MAKHTFTNNGVNITVNWEDTYDLASVDLARNGEETLTVQIVYDLGDRELVQEVEETKIIWYRRDIQNRWKEYLRFKGDTMPLNPEKRFKGTLPLDTVTFANNEIPMGTVDYFSRNVANQMVNSRLSRGAYKVSPFNQTTLQTQQPTQFTLVVTGNSVTATVIDGAVTEWSIDEGVTKQASPTFGALADGVYTIQAFNGNDLVNEDTFNITTMI